MPRCPNTGFFYHYYPPSLNKNERLLKEKIQNMFVSIGGDVKKANAEPTKAARKSKKNVLWSQKQWCMRYVVGSWADMAKKDISKKNLANKTLLQLDDMRVEVSRREQEIMQMATKMKTLEEQHQDYQKHIAVLKESLCAKEEHYTMLQTDVSSAHHMANRKVKLGRRWKRPKLPLLRTKSNAAVTAEAPSLLCSITPKICNLFSN